MAFTNTVRKQLDVLTIVAVHRRRRLVGHTAKLMRELSSPCFAVGAHGSVSCPLGDHNDYMRNPELQIFSMTAVNLTATVFQCDLRLTSGRWLT